MKTALLVITDGRADCLGQTIASAQRALPQDAIAHRIVVNDSLNPAFGAAVAGMLEPAGYTVLQPIDGKRGFAGAVQAGWDAIAELDVDFVFHLEDDFVFNRPVPLARMAAVLDAHPDLVQLVLKRQPWNEDERAAGGIVEQHPGDYTAACVGRDVWTEHRRFFSTNPSLYRAELCALGWPQVPHSEGVFTHQLLADPALRFAFWGAPLEDPAVTHIGHERVGHGY